MGLIVWSFMSSVALSGLLYCMALYRGLTPPSVVFRTFGAFYRTPIKRSIFFRSLDAWLKRHIVPSDAILLHFAPQAYHFRVISTATARNFLSILSDSRFVLSDFRSVFHVFSMNFVMSFVWLPCDFSAFF